MKPSRGDIAKSWMTCRSWYQALAYEYMAISVNAGIWVDIWIVHGTFIEYILLIGHLILLIFRR